MTHGRLSSGQQALTTAALSAPWTHPRKVRCWLQRYAAARCNVMPPLPMKRRTIIPPPISDDTRHPVQSNLAAGSGEVLNSHPIQWAARYLTVGNFASAGGPSLELAAKTFQAVRGTLPNCPLLGGNAEVLSLSEAR